MKINKKFGDKIQIEWIDAYTEDKWVSLDEATKESPTSFCRTNAFYVSRNKNFVVVAHTLGNTKDDNIMGVLSIPKGWIKRVD
uniref:Uncharacterized protein n=1 Tax=viral metagenome TaxID=1070528 RepID=A0A6H2A4Z2_9ZZZZ